LGKTFIVMSFLKSTTGKPDIMVNSSTGNEWRIETTFRERNRRMKPFTTVAVIVFTLMGFIHLLRLFFGWEVSINGMILPVWISAPGLFIASGLALMLRRESRK